MELHTFSSLKKEFLPQYEGAMNQADEAIVYFSPEVVKHKKLEPITKGQVQKAFGGNTRKVFSALPTDELSNRNLNRNLATNGKFCRIFIQQSTLGLLCGRELPKLVFENLLSHRVYGVGAQ
jgi:UDP-N-acetylmuramate: L-alanyl-gamma-D-glutamyl-meso-diaminopimelate ligase